MRGIKYTPATKLSLRAGVAAAALGAFTANAGVREAAVTHPFRWLTLIASTGLSAATLAASIYFTSGTGQP